MAYLIVLVVMVVVGLVIGYLADKIFNAERPKGLNGDLIASVVTCVAISLMSWFLIPKMGFSQTMVYISLATEPALGAVIVLWLMRRANQ